MFTLSLQWTSTSQPYSILHWSLLVVYYSKHYMLTSAFVIVKFSAMKKICSNLQGKDNAPPPPPQWIEAKVCCNPCFFFFLKIWNKSDVSIGMIQHLLSAYIACRAMYNKDHMSVDIMWCIGCGASLVPVWKMNSTTYVLY